MRRSIIAILLCCLGSACLAGEGIKFHPSLEAARKDAKDKPLILYFSGSHCSWCRKMEAGTLIDDGVRDATSGYAWVKLDIANEEELALRYKVRGVPAVVILDAKNRVLANRSGYLPPDRFLQFLKQSQDDPLPEADGVDLLLAEWEKADAVDQQKAVIEKLVERLAKPDREQRRDILAAVATKPDVARPLLLDLMADSKLARRAAAYEALKQTTKVRSPFDPFGSQDARAAQITAWRQALKQ